MKCCLCGAELNTIHDSHNAEPVKVGRCCSTCKMTKVIPARLRAVKNPKPSLKWCSLCKENSVVTRISRNGKRVAICVNKGCGYVQSLPPLKKENE